MIQDLDPTLPETIELVLVTRDNEARIDTVTWHTIPNPPYDDLDHCVLFSDLRDLDPGHDPAQGIADYVRAIQELRWRFQDADQGAYVDVAIDDIRFSPPSACGG